LLGLMHDVGHGPFSHLFEREFLPQVISGSNWYSSRFNSFYFSLHFSL
jgi:HD superfamily phosphohydrolase